MMGKISKNLQVGKTGILDKHGVEIQEGDIVEMSSGYDHYDDYVGVVRRQSMDDFNTSHGMYMVGSRTVWNSSSVQFEIIGHDTRPLENHRRELV